MRKRKSLMSLQMTIAVFACMIVAAALMFTDLMIGNNLSERAENDAKEESLEIARVVANTPLIIAALNGSEDQNDIQPFIEKILQVSNVRFITVLDMHRIRKSHPNREMINTYYEENDIAPSLEGKETVSVNKGSLGTSLRVFVPVFTADQRQVGAVMVGIMIEHVQEEIANSRAGIYAGVGVGMLVGILGSLVLARKIKKILFGLEPEEIAKLYEERSAMLHSVREGILAVDKDSYVTMVNDEALRLFGQAGIYGEPEGLKVDEYIPNTRLQNVLDTGNAELDQEQDINGIIILTNRVPVIVNNQIVGAIATFRDKTEMKNMAEKIIGVSIYAEALRAQTHEFMNKLHVIQGMVCMKYYDQLSHYINEVAKNYQSEVGAVIRKIRDPVLAGFIFGKLSMARAAGVTMTIKQDSFLPEAAEDEAVHELITIIGNLLNNALEALKDSSIKEIKLGIFWENDILTVEINDTGPGIEKERQADIFLRGYSTKGLERGMGLFLVKQNLERLGGQIAVISEKGNGTLFRVIVPYWSKEENFD
ncbi:DcuS/MalK family sensor histidine kinase [Pectinatus haikarae]|uniref:histidine kinase n=1 Tax=Pectinatus haikarae TaxID=349096 RepID=A0ABT9YCC4_9FIRM|nr:DcuS/MalK family sensor histidine kinase [Pectinatus haikarae]MDQ0205171.1 CitB family two-component system sensor histidine kinase MalK [Pectinatus haikarae]